MQKAKTRTWRVYVTRVNIKKNYKYIYCFYVDYFKACTTMEQIKKGKFIMTKKLLENIDAIPALKESVIAVEKVYQDVDSGIEDMQKAIEKDPIMVANILRLVNSPMYGLKSQITSIKQAISLLGKGTVRTFVLNSVVDSNFELDLSPYGMNPAQFMKACDRQQALMINWIIRRKPTLIGTMAPAAFLVDIGRVVIAKTLSDEKKSIDMTKDITQAEKEVCGAQTTDVTATLFRNWNLDPDIIHLIRYSDDPEGNVPEEKEMSAELKAVRETVLPNGEITEESISNAKETIEEFDLDLESYERALDRVLAA